MKQNRFHRNLIVNLTLLIFFAIVLFAAIISPYLFSNWVSLPFIGGFLDPTFHFKQFNKTGFSEIGSANDLQWGMREKLISLDSWEIKSQEDFSAVLVSHKSGDIITALVQTDKGKLSSAPLILTEFSPSDKLLYFYLPYLLGLVCFLVGVWYLSDRRQKSLSVPYAILSGSIGLIFFSWFDYYSTHILVPLLYIGIAMAAAAVFQIAILIPRNKRLIKDPGLISFLAYPVNLSIVGLGVLQFNQPEHNFLPVSILSLFIISAAISVVGLIASLLILRTESLSPFYNRYSQAALGAVLLSILPFTIHLLVSLLNDIEPLLSPFIFLPFGLLPIALAFFQRPFFLSQEKSFMMRVVIYFFLSFIFGVFYSLVLSIINSIFMTQISSNNPLILGLMIFFTVLVFFPVRKRMEKIFISPITFIHGNDVELALEYSETLSAANNVETATQILYDGLMEIFRPEQVLIFLFDPKLAGYSVAASRPAAKNQSLVLSSQSDLVRTLQKASGSIHFKDKADFVRNFPQDAASFDQLDVHLHVPIPGSDGLLGWVSLGKKMNNEPYKTQDITLLESLTAQFSLIYERADTIRSLRLRLNEMEILNKIAVSINQSNDMDTLLMTISDQLQPLLKFEQLSLIMKVEETELFKRQFQYKNHEVLISSHDPVDLEHEFPEKHAIMNREFDIVQEADDVLLVIPLKAEEQTFGALSLLTKNDKLNPDSTGRKLLNSIGNLITGAIIKTRLLQESQAQAQHLSILNQVSRQMASTLVMEKLLETIVDNAVTILNGSSGILLIQDDCSDELVIEVTAGQIDPQIKGKRVVLVEGIASEALQSRKPVILNHYDPSISPILIHQVADIQIENVIVTPLILNSVVIGLLYIFNKNNHLLFNEKDQDILEGLASQAAVAIGNARLYTKTDRALEKRIEELSLMQRIDRDLHSSPTLDAALQTTLRAALSQTQALCGTIAIVDTYNRRVENLWRIIPEEEHPIPLEDMELKDFYWFTKEMTESYQIIDSSVSELNETLNLTMECETHFLIQSKLDDNQYSLLILHLESANKLSKGDIEFLNRLNDHAAIALRNALLYEDLQAAVQSKNEFIGFISHELKNPLTAIKGHADILAKGIVGQINQEQEDFLQTISHNVRRMSTFIADLSDQSQIETKSLRITFAATSANEVLEEILQSYGRQFREKSIHVEHNFPSDLPDVWCDRIRLIQVLSNLVSNAVKYTPEGGKIEIGAEYAINNWDQEGAAEVVHFWVKDNGYGIAPNDQEHIFDKFFRGSSDNILNIPGTGLGLRISKSLVEMMGGTMWFDSTWGEGSIFHFTIPI